MNKLVVVTGIPRSGTSMMMRCLEIGGIPCIYNDIQKEEDKKKMRNIYGFYEFGKIPKNANVAVKRFGHLTLKSLAKEYDCYFIFMLRDIDQIHKSWQAVGNYVSDSTPPSYQERQQRTLNEVKNHKHIIIEYDKIIQDSEIELLKLKDFLPMDFDVDKALMGIDKNLYIKR